MTTHGRARVIGIASAMLVVSLAVFAIGIGVAMAMYPGGTWFDPAASSHSFWRNFFSDLLHATALDGDPNPGARWARVGMAALLPALAAFWTLLGQVLVVASRRLAGRAVQVLGIVCAVSSATVPLTPTDTLPFLHGLAVLAAAGTGVAAATVGVVALWRADDDTLRRSRIAGSLTLAAAALALGSYVHHQFLGADLHPLTPASQKLAALALIGWMMVTVIRARRPSSEARRPSSERTNETRASTETHAHESDD